MSFSNKENETFDLIVKNGRFVRSNTPEVLDIGVKHGQIALIEKEINNSSKKIIDASNRLIFQGFIDPHTHMGIPIKDTTSADDFESGSIAAAYGGVTTILDFSVQRKGQSLREALRDRLKLAKGKSHIDFGIHINITDQPEKWLHQIPELTEEGFSSFKVFSTYREAGMMVNWSQFRQVLKEVNDNGGLLMLHAENNDIIERETQKYLDAEKFTPLYHAKSRPAEAEARAIENAARIAGELDAPLYIVHLSSKQGLEKALKYRQQGVKIYLETCPQYLLLTEKCYQGNNGHLYIATPALRQEEDCEALWQAVQDGTIDTVGTDHCPFTISQKNSGKGKFHFTPNGLSGVERVFSLLYTYGVERRGITDKRLIEILSKNAARIFKIDHCKGEIRVGADADLVIWDPSKESKISTNKLHSKTDWSPYDNMQIAGQLDYTILRGRILISSEELDSQSQSGKLLLSHD
jgi:dihydropyrimidinase